MFGRVTQIVAAGCAVVLAVALGFIVLRPAGTIRVTGYFTESVGLYAGSNVVVLGLPVGKITEVTPMGDRVRVRMEIDDGYKIPADAKAAVVAPSLVADRYVQLTPAYAGGGTMADGATLGADRTAVPVELDQIYSALDQLSTALGPTGANANGALSDLVDVAADNLDGNGSALNSTITNLSQAVRTLADNRDNLFDSVDNLQTFTTALASIDSDVAAFNQNLSAVSDQLVGDRQDLASALSLLTGALSDVNEFIRQNSSLLTSNVDKLADVALTLAQHREALSAALQDAPAALSNVGRAYNASAGTLDTRDDALDGQNLSVTLCNALSVGNLLGQLSEVNQAVCTKLLSGDTDGDGVLDDLDGNGTPDLQELLNGLAGTGASTGSLPGIGALLGGQ